MPSKAKIINVLALSNDDQVCWAFQEANCNYYGEEAVSDGGEAVPALVLYCNDILQSMGMLFNGGFVALFESEHPIGRIIASYKFIGEELAAKIIRQAVERRKMAVDSVEKDESLKYGYLERQFYTLEADIQGSLASKIRYFIYHENSMPMPVFENFLRILTQH